MLPEDDLRTEVDRQLLPSHGPRLNSFEIGVDVGNSI